MSRHLQLDLWFDASGLRGTGSDSDGRTFAIDSLLGVIAAVTPSPDSDRALDDHRDPVWGPSAHPDSQ